MSTCPSSFSTSGPSEQPFFNPNTYPTIKPSSKMSSYPSSSSVAYPSSRPSTQPSSTIMILSQQNYFLGDILLPTKSSKISVYFSFCAILAFGIAFCLCCCRCCYGFIIAAKKKKQMREESDEIGEGISVTEHNLGNVQERSFKKKPNPSNLLWGIILPITNLYMHLFRIRQKDITAVVPGNVDVETNDDIESFNSHSQNDFGGLGHVGGDGRLPFDSINTGRALSMENGLPAAPITVVLASTSVEDEFDEAESKEAGGGYLHQLVPLSINPTSTHLRNIMEDGISSNRCLDDVILNDNEEGSTNFDSAIAMVNQRNYVDTTGSSNFDDLRIDEYNSQDGMSQGDEMEEEGSDEFYYYEDAALTTAVAVVVSGVLDSSQSRGFRSNDESGDELSGRPYHDEVRSA